MKKKNTKYNKIYIVLEHLISIYRRFGFCFARKSL